MLEGFVAVKGKSKESEITVTLDGEPIVSLPARFQVYQNALSVKFQYAWVCKWIRPSNILITWGDEQLVED